MDLLSIIGLIGRGFVYAMHCSSSNISNNNSNNGIGGIQAITLSAINTTAQMRNAGEIYDRIEIHFRNCTLAKTKEKSNSS